jgi:hypothetical protein
MPGRTWGLEVSAKPNKIDLFFSRLGQPSPVPPPPRHAQVEAMDAGLLAGAVGVAHALDDQAGLPRKAVMSQVGGEAVWRKHYIRERDGKCPKLSTNGR